MACIFKHIEKRAVEQQKLQSEIEALRKFQEHATKGFQDLASSIQSEPEVVVGAHLIETVVAILKRQREEIKQLHGKIAGLQSDLAFAKDREDPIFTENLASCLS